MHISRLSFKLDYCSNEYYYIWQTNCKQFFLPHPVLMMVDYFYIFQWTVLVHLLSAPDYSVILWVCLFESGTCHMLSKQKLCKICCLTLNIKYKAVSGEAYFSLPFLNMMRLITIRPVLIWLIFPLVVIQENWFWIFLFLEKDL